jgi:elongation factor P
MLAKDTKPGAIISVHGAPHAIESVTVQSPSARGGATLYKFRARNLVTKQKTDLAHKGTDNLDLADFQKRAVTFMYSDAESVHFLDGQDYNQYSLAREELIDELRFITEDLTGMHALILDDRCVGIELPAAVELKITECDPGVKGNSATSRTKPATLETGFVVQVPEYLKLGETIKVDTRTGEFLSRA